MKVKINKDTVNRILKIDNKVKDLQKEMKLILEVYGNAAGLKGKIKINPDNWELEDNSEMEMESYVDK